MPSRTAEASKAVRKAWQREQELVQVGKGTRDWNEEQQQDILEYGVAYDDDGKAFQGHHMQNVEKHPEYQGEPDNIQFLTRDEHFKAHDNDWQNPTNGYYNYVTGETFGFGKDRYHPCEIIELSNPIAPISLQSEIPKETDEDTDKQSEKNIEEQIAASSRNKTSGVTKLSEEKIQNKRETVGFFEHMISGAKIGLKRAEKFVFDHWKGIGVAVLAIAGVVSEEINRKNSVNNCDTQDDCTLSSTDDLDSENNEFSDSDGVSGTPKRPHTRRGYPGHRWKKNDKGELELQETWIKETHIHKDQIEDEP